MKPHQTAFLARTDLSKYTHNALLLFGLQIRYQIEDIDAVASNALTDSIDDKKADLVYVNEDDGYAVIAQGYFANASKSEAPANKASDLNTAVSWLLTRPLPELPVCLRSAAQELREALADKKLRTIHFWYIHNLPESANVANELKTVELTANSIIANNFATSEVQEIICQEVGLNTLEEWYQALINPILVTDNFTISIPGGFEIQEGDWAAYVTAVPGEWLYTVFQNNRSQLFSANIRGYLGSTKADANINKGIKETAQDEPEHFWVFNNGLTALVHDFTPSPDNRSLTISGLSIVNGAQTTGALGTLKTKPGSNVMVPARFVKCSVAQTVKQIIKYNNSQNKVEAADFRSNDAVQRRLRDEFSRLPDVSYTGGRRGGHNDVIKRSTNLLPCDSAAQSLAAFHQDPTVAYHQKSEIWESNILYSKYFSDKTTAKHIVFCYGLLLAVDEKKLELVEKEKSDQLTETETTQLEFLRNRGSNFLLIAAIGKCSEIVLSRATPNLFNLSFGDGVSPAMASTIWMPIVESTLAFCAQLTPALQHGLKRSDEAAKAIGNFKSMVEATKVGNKQLFQTFTSYIVA